ncbi:MAG: hypothetical protein DIU78_008010 [Pseudomonadota bacterium]
MRLTVFLLLFVALVSCSKRKTESSAQPSASASAAVVSSVSARPPAAVIDEGEAMRTAEQGLRSMLQACSKQRVRAPVVECTDLMYSAHSMSAAMRSQLAGAPRTSKAWPDLDAALTAIDVCCGCDPKGAEACSKVEASLAALGKALASK